MAAIGITKQEEVVKNGWCPVVIISFPDLVLILIKDLSVSLFQTTLDPLVSILPSKFKEGNVNSSLIYPPSILLIELLSTKSVILIISPSLVIILVEGC